jgi:hypothetical protein
MTELTLWNVGLTPHRKRVGRLTACYRLAGWKPAFPGVLQRVLVNSNASPGVRAALPTWSRFAHWKPAFPGVLQRVLVNSNASPETGRLTACYRLAGWKPALPGVLQRVLVNSNASPETWAD